MTCHVPQWHLVEVAGRRGACRSMPAILAALALFAGPGARAEDPLPTPLTLDAVARLARERRPEVTAAVARAKAAAQRPAMVDALDDPMLMPSVEVPFMLNTVSGSLIFEQEFPLSPVLSRRGQVARAEARALDHASERTALDMALEATSAFHMLWGEREGARVLVRQIELARQLVAAATARYAAGSGSQGEVLRAEAERARLEAEQRTLGRTIAAREAMLATSLGYEPTTPIPELAPPDPAELARVPESDDGRVVAEQPAVRAGDEEIARWKAEVGAMRSMYAPMARLQTGPVYSEEMGPGWMLMFGVSLPIWRDKLDAGVEEARAMVRMAEADREAMRRMAAGELAQARQLVAAADERYRGLAVEVLPRARSAVEAALASYASGQAPQVSVIEAVQMQWMLEREVVMARTEVGLARARLDRALGVVVPGER